MSEVEARAVSKYIRISPRKARQVSKLVKGQEVEQAIAMLKFLPKKGAKILYKMLIAAQANAYQNDELKGKTLFVKNAIVDDGPAYKRVKMRARGRRDIIKKRMSHITVLLTNGDSE